MKAVSSFLPIWRNSKASIELTNEELALKSKILNAGTHEQIIASLVEQFKLGLLSRPLLTTLVPELWRYRPDGERTPIDIWRDMFLCCDYTHDFQLSPRPRKSMILYRGATPENREGLSWTTDIGQARYFAHYRQAPGTIDARTWVCRVPASRILATIEKYSFEHERVVDARGLSIHEFKEQETPYSRHKIRRLLSGNSSN